jgi:hypothetical protein
MSERQSPFDTRGTHDRAALARQRASPARGPTGSSADRADTLVVKRHVLAVVAVLGDTPRATVRDGLFD